MFLVANLTRFKPELRELFDSLKCSKLWDIQFGHATTLVKALAYRASPVNKNEDKHFKAVWPQYVKAWTLLWESTREMTSVSEKKQNWTNLMQVVWYGFLLSNGTYEKEIEPWALEFLNKEKIPKLEYVYNKVDIGPIQFVTRLVFCSCDWGFAPLCWTEDKKSRVDELITEWITTLKFPEKNLLVFLELGICKLLLGDDGSTVLKVLHRLYCVPEPKKIKKIKNVPSIFHVHPRQQWRLEFYGIHTFIVLFLLLLERKPLVCHIL